MSEKYARQIRKETRRYLKANMASISGKLALEMAELMRTARLGVRIPFAMKMAFGFLKASDFDSLVGKSKKNIGTDRLGGK